MDDTRRKAGRRYWIVPVIAVLMICAVFYAGLRLLGFSFVPYPQIVGQNCGEASGGGITYDPDQSEQCLWNAYTTCRTATLVYTFQGVDTRDTHAVTVQPTAGGCAVTDAVQGYSANFGGRTSPVTTYHCAGLRQQNGGLLLSGCGGEGDVYLPPRPPEQVGHVCGAIQNTYNSVFAAQFGSAQDTVAGIEDCFWQAYTNCTHPATLLYDTDLSTGTQSHTLVAQTRGGSCVISDAVWIVVTPMGPPHATYTCASLAQLPGGGLVAQSCGAEGDLTIPRATPPFK